MSASRVILALFSPVILLFGLAPVAQPQVVISDHTIQFESLSQQVRTNHESAPARQISFKSSVFVVADGEDLNNFRAASKDHPTFGSKLKGRKPLGRLLLVTTCSADCDSKDPQLSRTLFVNVGRNSLDDEWKQGAIISPFGLVILPDLFSNSQLEFAINGVEIHGTGAEMHIGNSSLSHYYIQVFEHTDSCRRYKAVYGSDPSAPNEDSDSVSIDLPWSRRLPQVANGIVIGAPKVYDTYALKALMNDTLHKLSAINPFVASTITGSYGNLQGITRNQSYLTVQGQVGTTASATTGITDSTQTCPTGYYPAGPSACAPVSGSSSAPITTTGVSQTITPTPVTPIPAVPASSPLPAPTNVGQSSTDALVEQVQLSGQLQMYQLLLEGAQSDSLFVQNARAVATRAQTTVSFPISIDPPRQFRHAVAEVRILIEPFPTPESGQTQPVSIVNLLPSSKTYNVAKITSKQHAFGAGAVIDQVASIGASTGKSKDRLYLAKDTDTVALQYDHPLVKSLHSPFPEKALTGLEEVVRMQRLDECNDEWFAIDDKNKTEQSELDSKTARTNAVMFGWQFRPVLGADYVASGPRQVFAQLALPEALQDSTFLPAVLVQTRWREYDERRQVVGPVFHSSCTVTSIKDPVIIQNPLRVHDTTWEDIGNGTLKIKAHGTFFSPGIALQSGKSTYSPIAFDGQEIQFFAPAKDLISNGEVTLVSENGRAIPLTIPLADDHAGCKIDSASLWAIPQADGTARVRLMLEPGDRFKAVLPRTRPLVLIGSDVYGLKDKPFQDGRNCDSNYDFICTYHFTAAADTLKSASNYYVRDLAWSNYNLPGVIHFAPFLATLAEYSDAPLSPSAKPKSVSSDAKTKQTTAVTFMVSGTDLKALGEEKSKLNLTAYSMDSPKGIPLTQQNLLVISDSEALLTLPRPPKGKTFTLAWTPTRWPLSREGPIVWDLTLPGQPPAAPIAVAPSYLNEGDSQNVTYTGSDFSTVRSVSFERSTPLTFKVSPDNPSSMDVFIPSSITKVTGHKELIATTKDKKGKAGQLILPLDVLKH